MKKLILLTLTVLLFAGCSKDDDAIPTIPSAPSGTMNAKVDGADYSNSNNSGQATLTQLPIGTNLIIQSSNSDGKSINLIVYNYTGVGTYDIDSSGTNPNTGTYTETDISNPQNTQVWFAPYQNSVIGTIKITEETDGNLKGEFNFTGKNSNDDSNKVITDGEFNLSKISI